MNFTLFREKIGEFNARDKKLGFSPDLENSLDKFDQECGQVHKLTDLKNSPVFSKHIFAVVFEKSSPAIKNTIFIYLL